jgi:hypothetical protein
MKEKVLPVKHIVDAEKAMKELGIKPLIKPIHWRNRRFSIILQRIDAQIFLVDIIFMVNMNTFP